MSKLARNFIGVSVAVTLAVLVGGLAGRAAVTTYDWRQDLLELPQLPVTPFTGRVSKLTGTAEKRALDGHAEALAVGSTVVLGEVLSTGPASSILLRMSTGTELTVGPDGKLWPAELSPDAEVYRLGRGSVDVVAAGSRRQVQITSGDGAGIVSGIGGAFAVLGLEDLLGVHAHGGTVGLTAAGQTMAVRRGRVAAAPRGEAPRSQEADQEPDDLQVDAPRGPIAADSTFVTGRADPLSLVTVNGILANVDGQGAFRARVPLREGVNRIVVVARHVSGKQKIYNMSPVKRLSEEEIRDLKVRWQGVKRNDRDVKWGGASR